MAGDIVNFEIPADDIGRARAFWSGLFGWEFTEYPGAPGGYHMTRLADGRTGAAITGGTPGATGPRVYLGVDDIDAGVARVAELGGAADPKMPVPGMGWFATCTDPHGNPFGLWQDDEDARTG